MSGCGRLAVGNFAIEMQRWFWFELQSYWGATPTVHGRSRARLRPCRPCQPCQDFLLQLLTRNNCRELPQSPFSVPQNKMPIFLSSQDFHGSGCCRFLSFRLPLIFNFVWLLSFLAERFVHFSQDGDIERLSVRGFHISIPKWSQGVK